MKKILRFSTFVSALSIFLSSNSDVAAQKPGYAFLRADLSARSVALGSAFTAMKDDISSIGANPAAIAGLMERNAVFSYRRHLGGINSGFLAYLHPLTSGNVVLSARFQDYGSLERTDASGNVTGTFGASNIVLMASYSRPYLKTLWVGGSAKFFRDAIDTYSSDGFAIDAGLYYASPILDNLNIGLSLNNIGYVRTAYISSKEAIPAYVELGASKVLAHLPLEWSLSARQYFGDDAVFSVGGEFTPSERLRARVGYSTRGQDQKLGTDGDRLAGVSAGFGLLLEKYTIDYAISFFGDVGTANLFTVRMLLK